MYTYKSCFGPSSIVHERVGSCLVVSCRVVSLILEIKIGVVRYATIRYDMYIACLVVVMCIVVLFCFLVHFIVVEVYGITTRSNCFVSFRSVLGDCVDR